MATWQERLGQAASVAKEQAERAATVAKRQAEKNAPVAKQRLGEAATIARHQAQQAAGVARTQAVRGKAVLDAKLAERKAAAEARSRWFLTEQGPVYTAGYPDEEATRRGIQAAAERGWTVESTSQVPERRLPAVGLSATLAQQALRRVLHSDQYLVTFRKISDGVAETEPSPEERTQG